MDLEKIVEKTLGILSRTLGDFGIDFKVIYKEGTLPYLEIKTSKDKVVFRLERLFSDVLYSDPKKRELDARLKDNDYLTAKIYGIVSAKVRTLIALISYDGKELEEKLIETAKKNSVNIRMLRKNL